MLFAIDIDCDKFISHQVGFRATRGGHIYSTKEYRAYQKHLKAVAEQQMPDDWEIVPRGEPIQIAVQFEYPERIRPKMREELEAKSTRPDITNLWKSVEDAMEGILYEDDASVQLSHLANCYVRGSMQHTIRINVIER